MPFLLKCGAVLDLSIPQIEMKAIKQTVKLVWGPTGQLLIPLGGYNNLMRRTLRKEIASKVQKETLKMA